MASPSRRLQNVHVLLCDIEHIVLLSYRLFFDETRLFCDHSDETKLILPPFKNKVLSWFLSNLRAIE